MTILQQNSLTKISGNLVLKEWYNKICTNSGRPYYLATLILSEIVYWYRPKVIQDEVTGEKKHISKFLGNMWQTSYNYLEKKFSSNHQSIRRALIRLEELNLIERHFKTVHLRGQNYSNVLFIKLNIENLIKISSCESITYMKACPQENIAFSTSKFVPPSLQNSSDNIDNKIKEKEYISRSGKSNFCKTLFLEEEQLIQNSLDSTQIHFKNSREEEQRQLETSIIEGSKQSTLSNNEKNKKISLFSKLLKFKRKKLMEFHPLNEEEADMLRLSSGREFSLHYMNQLLLKLAELKPDHSFYNKKNFLNYMTKVLANELRDATKVSNEGFRFKQEEGEIKKEKYLEEIEYCKDTTLISQLKRKIVAIFDNNTAYHLLQNCLFKEVEGNDNQFEIKLNNSFRLFDYQKQQLLEQIKSVYGNHIENLRITKENNKEVKNTSSSHEKYNLKFGKPGTIWHKISTNLAKSYGEPLHYSWFSKLEAEEDLDQRKITLKAPTEFIKYWIESNYIRVIEKLCTDENYNFLGIT